MDKFEQLRQNRDKFSSQFTIITYDTQRINVCEKLTHQIGILQNGGGDNVKRNYLSQKIWNLRSYLEKRGAEEDIINSIFLLDSENAIHEIMLLPEHLGILREWSVGKWILHRDEFFDIDFIKDLLTNIDGKHTVNIQNNILTHYLLTKTKRRTLYTEETKGLDLALYFGSDGSARAVAKWIPGTKTVIHGVSVAIKNFKPGSEFLVYTKQLHDDDINEIFHKEESAALHKEVADWMMQLTNPKVMHRIVFGANIRKKIQTAELKTLYATKLVATKMREKCPPDLLRTFEIRILEPVSGEITDSARRLETEYDGALGITYY